MARSKRFKAPLAVETMAICRKCLSTDGTLESATSNERGEYLLQQTFSCTNVQMKLLPAFPTYLCSACKTRFDFLDKLRSIWMLNNAKIDRLKEEVDISHLTGFEITAEHSDGDTQQTEGVGSVVKTEVAAEDSEDDYPLSQMVCQNSRKLSSTYDYNHDDLFEAEEESLEKLVKREPMDDQQQPQSSVADPTHEHNIFKTDPIDFNCKIEEEFSMARKPVTGPDNPTAISAQSFLGIEYDAEGPTFSQMDTYSEQNSVHIDNQPVSVVGEQRLLVSNKRRSSQKDIAAAEFSVQGPKATRNVHGNKRKHQCPHCSAAYREACQLKVHIRTHTGEKPFVCKLCSKTFHAADHLKHHMQTHNKDQNQCPYCPGQFAQPFQLENHIRTHTGEKPFLCKVCNKAFHVARYLTLHMQIHDKDQHKCPHCPDKFALLYRLKDHIRTHTGEKPFLCKVCGKTFHSARYLREHMQVHDKHQCPHCPKKFAQLFHLKNHIRTHTGEKPFICKVCSKAFHAARILRGHMQIHDKDQH